MLKIRLFLLVVFFIFSSNINYALVNESRVIEKSFAKITETTVKYKPIQKGRKTKDGRYKRKKGFMWGLFGKKKECDCPKN